MAGFRGLRRAVSAKAYELSELGGIDEESIALLHVLRTVVIRLAEVRLQTTGLQQHCEVLVPYLRVAMAYQRIEHFRVVYYDNSGVFITDELQQHGTIDHSPVYPREILRRAISLNASTIIIAHNHPSNNPTPSSQDISMTRTLSEALMCIGVVLFDHIIICQSGYISFRECGLITERCTS